MFPINIFKISHNKHVFTVLALIFVNKRQPFSTTIEALFNAMLCMSRINSTIASCAHIQATLCNKYEMCVSVRLCIRSYYDLWSWKFGMVIENTARGLLWGLRTDPSQGSSRGQYLYKCSTPAKFGQKYPRSDQYIAEVKGYAKVTECQPEVILLRTIVRITAQSVVDCWGQRSWMVTKSHHRSTGVGKLYKTTTVGQKDHWLDYSVLLGSKVI